jgi:CO/xanthine dehydrogenase FAD-binding subunit
MPKFWDEYHLPVTLDDALELLARYDGRARVVGGGTDLFLDLKEEFYAGARPHYAALIDVTRIAGANEIREQDGWIVIGCAVTHTQVVASPLIRARATALAEASGVVAGAQIRNAGTVVGNVAHALPAADSAVALAVLGAEAQIARANLPNQPNVPNVPNSPLATRRSPLVWQPIASLYLGPGKSAVDSTREIISAIRFRPTGANEGSAFARIMRPQGIALPILGMAARLKLAIRNSQFAIEDAAISAGPVAPTLFRATRTEEFLRGKVLDESTLEQAARILLSEAQPRTSAHRATREYRIELLPMMLRDVLTRAAERAKSVQSSRFEVQS